MSVVADAVARINRGDLEKVVLARDLIATSDEDVDARWPLRQLSTTYPTCWTFHVDGLVGATPEMLVRRERGLVTRSEEHTSELQSLMRISYAVFCLQKKKLIHMKQP